MGRCRRGSAGALAVVLSLGMAGAVASAARDTSLASRATGAGGAKGNGDSHGVLSGDGRHVVFASVASNLDPADPDSEADVFMRDLRTNRTTLISRASGADGPKGSGPSSGGSLSSDGRYVAFQSSAANLDPADTDQTSDVYVRDLETGQLLLVSRAGGAAGPKGDGPSSAGSLSADGRYVAFQSSAANLDPADPAHNSDVFLRDLLTNQLTLVSRADGAGGAKANLESGFPVLSADGRHVAFTSRASNLDPADTDTRSDVYVRDLQLGDTTLVSRADGAAGAKANGDATIDGVALSADGRYVAFSSRASNLDPADPDTVEDVFVRDLQTHRTTLASRADGVGGAKGNGISDLGGSLSADGRYVAFRSLAWNLDPLDSPAGNDFDVFVRDLKTGQTTLASRGASGAQGRQSSSAPSLSASGRYAAFDSVALNLHPADRDGIGDVFVRDVRARLPAQGRPPRSRIDTVSVRRRLVLGRARDDGEVQRVELSLTRRLAGGGGRRCQALAGHGRWVRSRAARGACKPRFLLTVHFTSRWRRGLPRGLARGAYTVTSRATDTGARRETRFGAERGNRVSFRVR